VKTGLIRHRRPPGPEPVNMPSRSTNSMITDDPLGLRRVAVSPVARPGGPLEAQLIAQSVGDRKASLMQAVDVRLEGVEKLGVSGRRRCAVHDPSLLGDCRSGGDDCAPEQRGVRPRLRTPLTNQCGGWDRCRHETTSPPSGGDSRRRRPARLSPMLRRLPSGFRGTGLRPRAMDRQVRWPRVNGSSRCPNMTMDRRFARSASWKSRQAVATVNRVSGPS
jgi:hypothetical protein